MKTTAQTNPASQQPIKAQVISNPFGENTAESVNNHQSNDQAQPSQPPINPAPQSSDLSSPPADAQMQDTGQIQGAMLPDMAADNDLIEKEWVDVIEHNIQAHGDDPYVLQQQLASLSRDYLKKRFNLDIEAA